ncbi:hypothetical protein Syun_009643 [Stephania yunnanensis]|uniref:Uncharacterized protein n=1 Tax=Stephania yunnanensis TaxID=152371 RepID=A0AAP0KH24_9MAGN
MYAYQNSTGRLMGFFPNDDEVTWYKKGEIVSDGICNYTSSEDNLVSLVGNTYVELSWPGLLIHEVAVARACDVRSVTTLTGSEISTLISLIQDLVGEHKLKKYGFSNCTAMAKRFGKQLMQRRLYMRRSAPTALVNMLVIGASSGGSFTSERYQRQRRRRKELGREGAVTDERERSGDARRKEAAVRRGFHRIDERRRRCAGRDRCAIKFIIFSPVHHLLPLFIIFSPFIIFTSNAEKSLPTKEEKDEVNQSSSSATRTGSNGQRTKRKKSSNIDATEQGLTAAANRLADAFAHTIVRVFFERAS